MYMSFLPTRVAAYSIKCICAFGWFVGIELLTVMFKNILRTFEAEIFKIFKNIQPQLKN